MINEDETLDKILLSLREVINISENTPEYREDNDKIIRLDNCLTEIFEIAEKAIREYEKGRNATDE